MSDTLPGGYHARHPELAEAEAIVKLVNACAIAYAGVPIVSVEQLHGVWQAPGHSPDDDWIVLAPDGSYAGMLSVFALEPYTDIQSLGVVHPAHEGRGLGAWLLGRAEARAERYLPLAPDDAAVTFYSQTFGANERAAALFREHAFDLARVFRLMTIDFDSAHPPAGAEPPDGITFRTFVRGQDERGAWRAAEESFEDHWNHSELPLDTWTQLRIETMADFDPDLWLLALDGDEVAGVALCDPAAPGQPNYGWVSTLGVRREWRGRGIASALLARAFSEFHRRGKRGVSLGVDSQSITGANRIYERAGMRVVTDSVVYAKQLRSGTSQEAS